MKKSYFLFAIFISTFLFSQTKLIAYKSHSGNMNHFETSVSKNIFDVNESNIGLPSWKTKVDSVIFIENDKAVVVTKTTRFQNDNEKGKRKTDTISLKYSQKNMNFDSVEAQLRNKNIYEIIQNETPVFIKDNPKNSNHKKQKISKTKPQIKKSEIKKESVLKNGLMILVFIISGFIALQSWRKSRRYES